MSYSNFKSNENKKDSMKNVYLQLNTTALVLVFGLRNGLAFNGEHTVKS